MYFHSDRGHDIHPTQYQLHRFDLITQASTNLEPKKKEYSVSAEIRLKRLFPSPKNCIMQEPGVCNLLLLHLSTI